MAIIEKEVVEDILYDYGRLMWQNNFYVPLEELEKFFAERGTTREEVYESAYKHGVIFTSATLEDVEEPKLTLAQRFALWVWR